MIRFLVCSNQNRSIDRFDGSAPPSRFTICGIIRYRYSGSVWTSVPSRSNEMCRYFSIMQAGGTIYIRKIRIPHLPGGREKADGAERTAGAAASPQLYQ